MRVRFLILAMAAMAPLSAVTAAHAAAPDALYAQRAALVAADRACDLLPPAERAGLVASTAQARGALLRSGWTLDRVDALQARAAASAVRRTCADPLMSQAVAEARVGFSGWIGLSAMHYPGGQASWLARRTPDPQGFYVRQDAGPGAAASLGVRAEGDGMALALLLPLADGEAPPGAARLSVRDTTRAPRSPADATPGRIPSLAALAPAPGFAMILHPRDRREERYRRTTRAAVFIFPPAAAARIAALDPREPVTAEIERNGKLERIHFEVGDFAAARAFVAARAFRSTVRPLD